jgi:hypothetical protein
MKKPTRLSSSGSIEAASSHIAASTSAKRFPNAYST